MVLHDFGTLKLQPHPSQPGLKAEGVRLVVPGLHRREDCLRRAGDLMIAATMILVLAPLMLATAAAVKLTSSGPASLRQQRVGLNRELFRFWKFRTMYVGADDTVLRDQVSREMRGEDTSNGGGRKFSGNDRIISVGHFLRRPILNELRQLLNAFLGTMSPLGPGPRLEWEAGTFAAGFCAGFVRSPLGDIGIDALTLPAVLRVDGPR